MKKLFSFLMIAAMLIVASCNRPEEGKDIVREGDLATVTFTVNAGDILTKAPAEVTYGNAALIDQLLVQVFNLDGEEFKKLESPEIDITPVEATTPTWDVQMKLAKNETYKIAFWAQKAGNTIYDTADLSKVTVDYTKMDINGENADYADVFCAARHLTVSGSLAETVELYRPLAQVNVAANDLVAYEKSVLGTKKTLKADITLPKTTTPCKLDVIGGTVAEDGVVTYKVTGYLENDQVFENVEIADSEHVQRFKSNDVGYDFLTMVYMLANPTKETIDFNIKIKNPATIINDLKVSNMPFQANYRTNIVGQLLTGSFEYTVEVEEGFFGIFEKKVAPTFESIADLNAYLATLKTGPLDADNGDIFPEEVVVEEVGEVATITLPNDTLSVAITILKPYDAELTIAYPTAEGAKHSNNVYLNIGGLTKLSANLTDTHMEIMAGSDIDLSDVRTSTTTFVVRKGARVGTLNVKQGNANIAGEVETLNVPTGATSNGEEPAAGNAVQIFLAKDAGVEQIVLAAKTDVVVEQPKDHIDEEETEKKVAVYVNTGADNSTAKTQNGGVIYVQAKVPCTVTADGVSEAESEEGNVASTVIIESGAAGSSVVAQNGAAINLTANGNCSASAEGKAEGQGDDPDTPSTITVKEVKDENIVIDANTSEGGKIDTDSETAAGAVKYFVAQIVGGAKYESLYDAVAAAESGAKIEMIDNSTETKGFTCTKSLTIDLCNFTVSYDSSAGTEQFPNTRAIKVGGSDEITFTIENGTIKVQDNIYGPFRFDNSNAVIALNDLVLNNGMAYGLGIKLVSAKSLSMEGCSVTSVIGGGLEQNYACPVTISDCEFEQTELDTQHSWISSAVSVCYNGVLNVDSGSYSGYTAAFVFSSGGTINISGGTFVGRNAAINVENNTWEPGYAASSVVNVTGGTFTGALKVSGWGGAGTSPVSALNISGGTFTAEPGDLFHTNPGTISITGGTFSEDPTAYVEEGYIVINNGDGTWTVVEDAVAKIGTKTYGTLAKAFADAQENDEIIVLKNCAVSTNIPVNFPVTLNVASFTITNNVTGNRMFRVGGATLFEIKGNGGKLVIPESNKNSYGFVDLRNQQNEASYNAGLKASNVAFNGATTGGSFFQARTHYQQFLFENVNVDCTDGDGIVYDGYANGQNASIINCYNCQICTVSIKGGTFKYASRGVNYGVFQDGFNAITTMEDVTVISTDGPVNQGMSYSCLIKNCNFANPNNVNAWDWTNTCICASSNKTIEVDGGTYEGNYACYVYTSGGTIHIKGGSFTGRSAVLIAQVDNNTYSTASSNIIVDGGTFNGPIKMDQGANCSITINAGTFTAEAGKLFGPIYGTLSIKGGTFSEDPSAYVAAGYSAIDNGDGTWTVIEGVIYQHSEEDTQNKGKFDNFIKTLPDGTKVLLTPGYYIGSQISEHNQIHEQNLTIAGYGDGVVFQGPGDGVSSVRGRYGLRLRSYAKDATPDHHEVTLKDLKIIGGYEPNWSSWMPALYCRGNLTANLENVVLESNNDVALEFDVKDDFMAAEGVYAEVNLNGVTIQEGKKINVSGDGTAATVRITWANCTNINDASFTCTGCENVDIYVNGVELAH